MSNSATKLVRFIMEHDGFIIWPDQEKDTLEWYKLLEELGVPLFEPSPALIDRIGDFARFMELGFSLMGILEHWKETMLKPITIKARNGKAYISRPSEPGGKS